LNCTTKNYLKRIRKESNNMLAKLKNLTYSFWNSEGRRVFHTFWQAAVGALVAGLVTVHSTSDVKAVVMVAVTAGMAAVKALVVSR
jgi:hypothetical protein